MEESAFRYGGLIERNRTFEIANERGRKKNVRHLL